MSESFSRVHKNLYRSRTDDDAASQERRAERLDLYSRPARRKEDRGSKGLQSSWISLGVRHQVFNVERSITLC